ncbi:MAG: cyclic nucleotide-binding domain (cNMP-BD) protein [Rhodoferax sp.]|nr:cyclic nucleotide-binding domain (cNMP-BD) protein [Rhodoferax sp.]
MDRVATQPQRPTELPALTFALNHLLDLLALQDRRLVLAACDLVPLTPLEVLCEVGQPTRHVFFPAEGSVSLMAPISGPGSLQVGLVGSEGMVGVQQLLGVKTVPLQARVQDAGRAWRMHTVDFELHFQRSAPLRRVLHHYVHVLMCQLAASAACLRSHLIGPRLARWLLMCQDRAASDHFTVTHETLALVLGVRRVSVTRAAGQLQRDGLITYSRGRLCVSDRHGLEAAACSCYAADRRVYADVLSPA